MLAYDPVIQALSINSDQHLDVLRLDLVDAEISGNKWFKLKKNLEAARLQNQSSVLTFGGAFSNHIAATASTCTSMGIKSIGVIRGEKTEKLNDTLVKAQQDGMQLHFVDRTTYATKDSGVFKQQLTDLFGDFYLIPEGGNNAEGVVGCMEILKPEWDYDYIFCACGTGTTYAGMLASVTQLTNVVGVSVLKGENNLVNDVRELLNKVLPEKTFLIEGNDALKENTINSNLITNNYSFNGYAKFDQKLFEFKHQFEKKHIIPLDYIYTNKLFYAVYDLIQKKKIPVNSKILIVHSGGLQGNKGFEERYKIKTPAV